MLRLEQPEATTQQCSEQIVQEGRKELKEAELTHVFFQVQTQKTMPLLAPPQQPALVAHQSTSYEPLHLAKLSAHQNTQQLPEI